MKSLVGLVEALSRLLSLECPCSCVAFLLFVHIVLCVAMLPFNFSFYDRRPIHQHVHIQSAATAVTKQGVRWQHFLTEARNAHHAAVVLGVAGGGEPRAAHLV